MNVEEAYGPIFKEPERRIAALDGIVSKLLITIQNQDRRIATLETSGEKRVATLVTEIAKQSDRISALEDKIK